MSTVLFDASFSDANGDFCNIMYYSDGCISVMVSRENGSQDRISRADGSHDMFVECVMAGHNAFDVLATIPRRA